MNIDDLSKLEINSQKDSEKLIELALKHITSVLEHVKYDSGTVELAKITLENDTTYTFKVDVVNPNKQQELEQELDK